ncbi:cellulose biosynthesis cyclic di-GMP-binding regulatory protein BcsB [Rhodovarius crocodyli]|nr:cellulose biosynthesis cyclic di-GMP-binding regulatory protein BcsB [Rhodovarius crocodyli]
MRNRHSGLGMIAGAILACASVVPAAADTLEDLGFTNGLVLQGSRSTQEVYFPMPANPVRPELRVDVNPSPLLDQLSSIQVLANDFPVASIPLRDGPGTHNIPIPPALARYDYLRIRFAADQALQREVLCFDNDTPAVWSHILPATRLTVDADGEEGVGVVWRRLTGTVPIALPSNPSMQDVEAALGLAVSLISRGAKPVMVGPGDASARIVIGRGSAPLSVEAMPDGNARLRVADTAAARALTEAAGAMRVIPAVAGVGAPTSLAATSDRVTFADLGVGLSEVQIFSEGTFEVEIPFNNLPPGRRPTAIRLFGRGPVMPPNNAMSVTMRVGQRVVWSETYRELVMMNGVLIPLPEEFIQHRMSIRLRFARIGFRPACDSSFLFAMSPSSEVILGDGYPRPTDFNGFYVSSDRPALVRVDVPAHEAVASIPAMATILSRAGARAHAIEVSAGARLDRPFLLLSRTAPSELNARALLRPDLGRVVLQDERNGARAEISPAAGLSVVQVAEAGGIPGLWFSPGSERSLTTPAVLSTGNVAVLDGSRIPASFDTRRQQVSVEEARMIETRGALSFLSQWRTELFIAGWVLLTVLVLLAVLRMRRKKG